jgi:CHAT domain
MKTITLEIGKLDANGTYPMRLWDGEIGSTKLAEAAIPQDLQVAGMHDDPRDFSLFVLTTATSDPKFGEIGEDLMRLLNRGQVGQAWASLRQENQHLRTLLLMEDHDLQLLPWELLNDGNERLWLQADQPILRAASYQWSSSSKESLMLPLRALVVIGSKDKNIGVEQELEKIEEALRPVNRTIDVEVLRLPTKAELTEKLGKFRPHIFHFIGHSGQNADQNLVLWLEGKGEQESKGYWTAAEIKNNRELKEIKPRFVFLNSCRSGNAPTLDDQKNVLSISAAFRDRGIPAVLAMQADVQGEDAGLLAGTLYQSLAEGNTLDIALIKARNKVQDNITNGLLHRAWALPSLTVSMPPEQILGLKATAANPQWAKKINLCPEFREVIPQFVNRKENRRSIVHSFYPISPTAEERHLTIIRGKSGMGKSWIVHWCLEGCARQSHNVRYVPIVDTVGKDWLDVLLQIRDGDPSLPNSLIHEALDAAAFADFNWELHHRLQGKEEIPLRNGRTIDPPPQKNGQRLEDLGEHFAKKTFASFRAALQLAAAGQPLILALDDFTKGDIALPEAHLQKYLIPELLYPLVAEELLPIKLILILTEAEYFLYKIGDSILKGLFQEVELKDIPAQEFESLAKEYLRSFPLEIAPDELILAINYWKKIKLKEQNWSPIKLKKMYEDLVTNAE